MPESIVTDRDRELAVAAYREWCEQYPTDPDGWPSTDDDFLMGDEALIDSWANALAQVRQEGRTKAHGDQAELNIRVPANRHPELEEALRELRGRPDVEVYVSGQTIEVVCPQRTTGTSLASEIAEVIRAKGWMQ